MTALSAEATLELWRKLGRPAAAKLRQALLNRGHAAPSAAFLQENLLKQESSKQVFAPPPRYRGAIYSPGIDRRWACDVMVQPAGEFKGEKYTHALIVQDIFSRFAWGELIKSPMDSAEGLRKIIQEARHAPSQLICDADPGFQTRAFKELLEEHQIQQTIRVGRNDLATVDRLIGNLKRQMASDAHDTGDDNWAAKLHRLIAAQNESPNEVLLGSQPEKLRGPQGEPGNKVLYFLREEQEAKNIASNDKQIRSRIPRLQQEGAFRVWDSKDNRLKGRIFNPKWSTELHRVAKVQGAYVTDEQGREFATKETLAVPKESTALTAPAPKLNAKARGMLDRYMERGKAFLLGKPDRRAEAGQFYNALAAIGNIKEALALAQVQTKAPIKAMVALFPDTFALETSKKGGLSHVVLR